MMRTLTLLSCVAAALGAIPVYVMMPLDTVSSSGLKPGIGNQLAQLASGGVKGIMVDCWWGLTERSEKQYDFSAYVQLAGMVQSYGMEMEVVMSFHRCGGNVGDNCNIPLPDWVRGVANYHDIWYADQYGNRNEEYISLFVDNEPIFGSLLRTPITIYRDYMSAFNNALKAYIGNVIVEIQVGAGPAGELRYPSYPLDKWVYCGVGEFQSYNYYALKAVQAAAQAAGHPEWGTAGGPNNAGNYNSRPYQTGFFSSTGFDNYMSSYGRFYLSWYTQTLVAHGDALLGAAKSVFGDRLALAMKVAGIHWWYKDASHAAELTAGYYNIPGQYDAYGAIAAMMAKHGAYFDFTCLEMQDSEQDASCASGPYELVGQTKQSAIDHGIGYSGENALPRYDQTAYNTIKSQCTRYGVNVEAFTYLRLTDSLLSGYNWDTFRQFVTDMSYL